MKLQIKTLNRKTLLVDIDEDKTVYDLKHELALYADVGVKPELQQLIYLGSVMNDDQQLSCYNIDTGKFLVVMVLKDTGSLVNNEINSENIKKSTTEPLVEQPVVNDGNNKVEKVAEPLKEEKKEKKDTEKPRVGDNTKSNATGSTTVDMALVEQIVSMGYEEGEVRRALAASYNNAERAVQYLVEGIPSSSEMALDQQNSYSDTGNESMLPFQIFRNDPMFRRLRNAIHQNPQVVDDAVAQIAENCPALQEVVAEYQDEFLSALIDHSDDENDLNE